MLRKIFAMLTIGMLLAGGFGCGGKAGDQADADRVKTMGDTGRSMSQRDRELYEEQKAEGASGAATQETAQ